MTHTIKKIWNVSNSQGAVEPGQVKLIVAGMTAYIQPACDSVVVLLQGPQEILRPKDQVHSGMRALPLPWFRYVNGKDYVPNGGMWFLDGGRMSLQLPAGRWYAFPAGLADTVRIHLQEQGNKVEFYLPPLPNCQHFQPAKRVLRHAVAEDRELLRRVRWLPRGLIRVKSQRQAVENMALITRMFPTARIFLPVYTIGQGRRLRRLLTEEVREQLGFVHQHRWQDAKRCTVVTFHSFQHVDRQQVDVVIVPDAMDVLGSVPQSALSWLPAVRAYGFVSPEPLLPADRLILASYVGPEIFTAPPCTPRAQVQVLMCDIPFQHPQKYATALERERSQIWQNKPRNQFIADVASACANGEMKRLWKLGLLLDDTTLPISKSDGRSPSIVILVEGTEHAQALRKLLPIATTVHKSPANSGTVTISPRTRHSRATIMIMTTVAWTMNTRALRMS